MADQMYIIQCILISALIPTALIGIIGNLVTMLIYFQPKMRSSINVLISGLACADALLLLTGVSSFLPFGLQYTIGIKSCTLLSLNSYITIYLYPFALMCQTAGVYILVLITMERFVAVCRPLEASYFCTVRRAEIGTYIILIASVCFNLSRLFEYKVVEAEGTEHMMRVGESNCSTWAEVSLRADYHYSLVYTFLLNDLCMFVVPFSILLILNYRIVRELHNASKFRRRIQTQDKTQKKTTFMMFLVTLIFLVCNLPAFIMAIIELIYFFKRDNSKPEWFYVATDMNNLLVMGSSAVNPIIYFCLSQRYKEEICQRLQCSSYTSETCTTLANYHNSTTGYTQCNTHVSDIKSTEI